MSISTSVCGVAEIAVFRRIIQKSGWNAISAAQFEDAGKSRAVDVAMAEEAPDRIKQLRMACLRDFLRHLRKIPAQDFNRLRPVRRLVQPGDRTAVAPYEADNLVAVLPRPTAAHRCDIALIGPDDICSFRKFGEAGIFCDDVIGRG